MKIERQKHFPDNDGGIHDFKLQVHVFSVEGLIGLHKRPHRSQTRPNRRRTESNQYIFGVNSPNIPSHFSLTLVKHSTKSSSVSERLFDEESHSKNSHLISTLLQLTFTVDA